MIRRLKHIKVWRLLDKKTNLPYGIFDSKEECLSFRHNTMRDSWPIINEIITYED
jgi:hypothetical protein